MADRSKIEWTEASWNPVTGCTEVSPGCDRCYAKVFAERWRGTPGHPYENGFDVQLRRDRLDQPLKWRRGRRIFVNSMSDLFHDEIPEDYIAQVFAVMAAASQHVFQVLTKRHGRMRSMLRSRHFAAAVQRAYVTLPSDVPSMRGYQWPIPNVWLGVSVENQQWADIRIPALKETPAAVRWISAEPLLERVDRLYLEPAGMAGICYSIDGDWWHPAGTCPHCSPGLDWVVVGGESGHGFRPFDPDWARAIRDACQQAGVPFLFKQHGGRTPKAGGRELDGRTWDQYPKIAPQISSTQATLL